MGVPHNAISVSLLEQFTGRQLGFFEWMRVGVPVFLALLVAFYGILWVLVRPEIRDIPSGEAFLRAERAKLGGLRANERRVMFVFAMMVTLFTLPTLAALAFGAEHPVAQWAIRALPVWVVPPAVMFLLFTIRSSDQTGDALLTWRDAEHHGPWNTMFLVGGAVAMTDALTQFGFVELMGGVIKGLGIGSTVSALRRGHCRRHQHELHLGHGALLQRLHPGGRPDRIQSCIDGHPDRAPCRRADLSVGRRHRCHRVRRRRSRPEAG